MTPVPEHVDVDGRLVHLVRVAAPLDPAILRARLRGAGLPIGVPVVLLVGGAGGLGADERAACVDLFASALVPVLEKTGAVLVDGGTDSGIMALAGMVRRVAGARGLHVGVVAERTVRWPGAASASDTVAVEPHHTHIVVVPGNRWGDEVPWLSAVATALADGRPSVTVLANGGDIAYDDVNHSLDAGRPVLVLAGTGRTAANIAAARSGEPADPRALRVAAATLLHVVPNSPGLLTTALTATLRS
jgi:hypothetical protein